MPVSKRNAKLLALGIVGVLGIILLVGVSGTASKLVTPQHAKISVGGTKLTVEIADTYPKRVQGLSGRDSLSTGTGLLFIFEKTDRHGIWMRDMQFSIDIIWINEDKRIVHIEENIPPESYPAVFEPDEPARYVLELRAGAVEMYGIQEGDLTDFSF